jgi:hypothetical protein
MPKTFADQKTKTVGDLIAELQRMPQELPVYKEYDGSLQEPVVVLSTDPASDKHGVLMLLPDAIEPCVVIH